MSGEQRSTRTLAGASSSERYPANCEWREASSANLASRPAAFDLSGAETAGARSPVVSAEGKVTRCHGAPTPRVGHVPGMYFPRGAQLRIPAGRLQIRVTEDGRIASDPLIPQTRMDMWPQWLHEALEATVNAREVHTQLIAEAERPEERGERFRDLLDLELRASMRAITAAAFAVDAFYASVQARSPDHPHRALWRSGPRRTPRHVQVFETLRYHLKVRAPGATEFRRRVKDLFKFRGWAVHADASFRDPVLREDVDVGLDWHYVAFQAENAVTSLTMTLQMLDVLVSLFERGSDELREWGPAARERLDAVLDRYDAMDGLPPIARSERQGRDD